MKKVLLVLLIVFLFSFCGKKKTDKTPSVGRNAEILVLCPKSVWESVLGDSIRAYFGSPQIGLNQPEPMFRFLNVTELDKLYQKHRNILELKIDTSFKEAQLYEVANLYAAPQIYFRLEANNFEEAIKKINKTKKYLVEKFRKNDYERIKNAFKSNENIKVRNEVRDNFGFEIVIPQAFFIATINKEFAWLRQETSKYSQAILIYTMPYNDTIPPSLNFLMNWRNVMTQKYVPGTFENTYMTVDTVIAPVAQKVSINENSAIEVRGLWRVKNDFMGGPFCAYYIIDKKNKRLIALDGYVYYPNNEKRDLLLQLEAICHSIKFVDEK